MMETFEKVKWKQFILPVVIGLVIWFIAPVRPAGISLDAWHMLAIFIATIAACITQPMAIAGVTLIGFTMAVCLGLAPIADVMKDGKLVQKGALSAFSNSSAWG